MNDAGKVAFTPKGDYSSAVTYEYLDTVVYNGNAYAALKTTTGNAPTDADTDENWKLLARGGTSVPVATEEVAGVVKASSDIGVNDIDKMVLKTDYTEQESLTELTGGDDRSIFFGKIAKAVNTLIDHIELKASSSAAGHVKVSSSASITKTGEYALDATEKNTSIDGTLANQIGMINTNLEDVSTNLENLSASVGNMAQTFSFVCNGVTTSNGIYIKKPDGNSLKSGRYKIDLLSATALATECASSYIVNITSGNMYKTVIHEGTNNAAPRIEFNSTYGLYVLLANYSTALNVVGVVTKL